MVYLRPMQRTVHLSDDEWTDLGALAIQQYPDPAGRLSAWAKAFVRGTSSDLTTQGV